MTKFKMNDKIKARGLPGIHTVEKIDLWKNYNNRNDNYWVYFTNEKGQPCCFQPDYLELVEVGDRVKCKKLGKDAVTLDVAFNNGGIADNVAADDAVLPPTKDLAAVSEKAKNLALIMRNNIKSATDVCRRLSPHFAISGVEAQPEPQPETTHTFSAELPSGEIVEMPSPGADWTEGDTETFKRGDMRVKNLYDAEYSSMGNYQIQTVDKRNISDCFKITNAGACWAKEILKPNEPILSITTWTRKIQLTILTCRVCECRILYKHHERQPFDEGDSCPMCSGILSAKPQPYNYRDASEDNHIGLEIWPGREDQQRHDAWNAIPHTHREPSSYNTRCLEAWPERDGEID